VRVLRVEFTWQVPFKLPDGTWDHRRIFEARNFDLWWHRRAGGVLINGVFVHAHQAAIEVDGCVACETAGGLHAPGCPFANPPPEVTDGAADPGPPGAPAGRKSRRQKG
jgi:hypothetical protein